MARGMRMRRELDLRINGLRLLRMMVGGLRFVIILVVRANGLTRNACCFWLEAAKNNYKIISSFRNHRILSILDSLISYQAQKQDAASSVSFP